VTAPARSPQSPRLAPSGVACRPVETCDEGRSSARLKKPATALKQGRVLSGRKLAWSGRSDEGQSAGSPMVPDGMACAPRRSAGRPRFGSLVSGRPLKTAVSSQTSGEGGCSTLRTKTPPPWRRGNLEYCGPASMAQERARQGVNFHGRSGTGLLHAKNQPTNIKFRLYGKSPLSLAEQRARFRKCWDRRRPLGRRPGR